jgi:hypothetical protein
MSKRCFLPRLRPSGAEFSPIITACLLLLWGAAGGPPAARAAEEDGFLQQARKLEKARAADPAWKPKYKEEKPIKVSVKSGSVNNFCLSRDGQLLVCVGLSEEKDKGVCELQVLSPSGKLVNKVPLPFNPQAICTDDQGFIYVGGGGKLCKLSPDQKILEEKPVPALQMPAEEQKKWKAQMKDELQRLRKEYAEMNPPLPKADLERMLQEAQKSLEKRRGDVTGLAVVGQDLFVATPSPAAFGYMVWKVDARLSQPKAVISRLSGCCGQMDIRGHDGKLWVAHNGKHKVECYQPNGTMVSSFGRTALPPMPSEGAASRKTSVSPPTGIFWRRNPARRWWSNVSRPQANSLACWPCPLTKAAACGPPWPSVAIIRKFSCSTQGTMQFTFSACNAPSPKERP